MIRQFALILICCLILLVGCSSESTIRKELYDDSLKYYNLMNERVVAIETYTEEDKKNLKAYDDKYTAILNDLNKEERALYATIGGMAMSLDLINETYSILGKEGIKETVEDFVRDKLEAGKILGVE
ncbi:hypothetical protein [Brevibacillus sp. NRS-1366]|uniref:hypothetical protein n=1 Tax=Brevibacillus sp. NRS-1366 TaxID=3233899 RepID=UPI003D194D71